MNMDSLELLKECSSGCKMGMNSIEQVSEYVEDIKLLKVLEKYRDKHNVLLREATELLKKEGKEPEKPGKMASMMSWITTEMKMMMEDDSSQVAKLMMDGCNMGIQTITEKMHEYKNAEKDAVKIAESLVELEEEFHKEMKKFL